MQENKTQSQEDTINILEYIVVVLKHKEFIIKTTLVAVFVAGIVSFLIPPTYLAETKILPPQTGNSSMASLMASQIAGMGVSSSAFGMKSSNDLYVALLKTHKVSDYIIDKCDLFSVYKTQSRERLRQILLENLAVNDDRKSGILTIGFVHRVPSKAAEIANAYVGGLQNLNNSLAVTEAGQRRLFFEEQLKNAKEALVVSEDALKSFQQRTGTIKIDEETKAVAESVADMRAKISAKEVQLRVMRTYATSENPDFIRLQDEVQALRQELGKVESKATAGDVPGFTVGKLSSMGTEYLRRMREFKYRESLYEIFLKQYSAAKLDESRDAALIQIVEPAENPKSKFKPSKRKIVLNTLVFVFPFSIIWVFVSGYLCNLKAAMYTGRNKEIIDAHLDFSLLVKEFYIPQIVAKIKNIRG